MSFMDMIMATGLLCMVACSPAPAPVSASASDPSSPQAPEGVPPPSPQASDLSAAADAGAEYVCPMHPEVTASGPSRCPKCGMNLVPKK